MKSKKVVVEVAPSVVTLLTVLFVGLKLTGYITWSWWWVLVPLWMPLALVISIFSIVFIGAVGIWLFKRSAPRKLRHRR